MSWYDFQLRDQSALEAEKESQIGLTTREVSLEMARHDS
jgi:hypothetical protein